METKERKNTNTIPKRANSGKGVECLKMRLLGKLYDTKFTISNREFFLNVRHAQTNRGCDIHLNDGHEGHQKPWRESSNRYL